MFNGKIHYKWPFSIAMLNYQRVTIDITIFPYLSYLLLRYNLEHDVQQLKNAAL